ncbi:MAG: cellulose biosynthesis protein CelD, partial [Pseudomonadota bacterium]
GTDGYQRHYATHPRYVTSGIATIPSTAGWVAANYDRLENALKERTGDALGKFRRRYSQIAACEPTWRGRSSALASAIGSQFRSD